MPHPLTNRTPTPPGDRAPLIHDHGRLFREPVYQDGQSYDLDGEDADGAPAVLRP